MPAPRVASMSIAADAGRSCPGQIGKLGKLRFEGGEGSEGKHGRNRRANQRRGQTRQQIAV